MTDDGALGEAGRSESARDVHWAAPEHLVVETFSAVRGRYRGRHISARRARDAMWALRGNVSGCDAAYLATAEEAGCPLVTADERLSRAKGLLCEVRVAVPSG